MNIVRDIRRYYSLYHSRYRKLYDLQVDNTNFTLDNIEKIRDNLMHFSIAPFNIKYINRFVF